MDKNRETQNKAIAGALASFVGSIVPIVIATSSNTEPSIAEVENFKQELLILGSMVLSALVGWIGVYFAPRNKPIEN